MVDDKLPLPSCPWCASADTVRTMMVITRAFYFCLACGKSFERRLDTPATSYIERKPEKT